MPKLSGNKGEWSEIKFIIRKTKSNCECADYYLNMMFDYRRKCISPNPI